MSGDAVHDARAEAADATRGSGVRLAAEIGGRALSLATSFLIAVGLGVEAFGVYAALTGVAVILAEAGELGIQGTAQRALVARTIRLRDLVKTKLALGLLLVAAAPLVPFAVRSVLSLASGVLPAAAALGAASRSGLLLVAFVFYFALSGWSELFGVALRARGRRGEEAALILCLRACGLVAVATAIARAGGLAGVAWAHVLSTVPPVLLGAFLVRRAHAGDGDEAPAHGIRDVLRVSWPLAVNGGLALLSLRVELLVIFGLRGPREAGLFGAALKFVESLNAVPAAIAGGAMPALTREALRGSGLVRARTAATVALLAVPGAAGLALLAPGVSALLGAAYADAAAPLRVLAPALVALFMNTVLLHALIAAGRAHTLPKLTALRVLAATACAFVLVPRFGVTGAALGFLLSELILGALAWRACAAARFPVPLAAPLALAACVSLPMAAAVALFGGGAVAAALLGALVYGATLALVWRMAPDRFLRYLHAEVAP
ncbi:MAG: oligosaccharide flippase family protein [Vicinamibacteria bacterium]